MKRIKIADAIVLSFLMLTSAIVYGENITKTVQVTYRNISIQVNGKIVPSEQEPFIYKGHTFAPLRTIGEAVNKTVEWDNAKNQVSIIDKPIKADQNFLSFPLHKIGERAFAHPYAVTIKKVYHGTQDNVGRKFEQDTLMIEIQAECFAKNEKILQLSRPFTLWDKNSNKIAIMNTYGFSSLYFYPNKTSDGYLFLKLDGSLKNKKLILVFYPVDTEHGDPIDEINVFLAFDLGKIE